MNGRWAEQFRCRCGHLLCEWSPGRFFVSHRNKETDCSGYCEVVIKCPSLKCGGMRWRLDVRTGIIEPLAELDGG